MKKTGLIIAAMFSSIVLLAQTEIPLYNGSVPNSKPAPNKESSLTRDNVTRISKVSVPTLTVYKPANPNGMSVIICPGGGYGILAFDKEGTITAANASTLNDGASALILASKEAVEKHGLKPIAKIVAYADAAHAPEWFTTAPSQAIPKALAKANLTVNDINYWELNQAFAVVGLANIRELGLDASKVDVNGGAIALGHPLGNSGSRIIVTLINVLKQNNGKLGGAGICNGGGGASAMIIENI